MNLDKKESTQQIIFWLRANLIANGVNPSALDIKDAFAVLKVLNLNH